MCSSNRQFSATSYTIGNSGLVSLVGAVVLAMAALSVCGCAVLWPSTPPKAEDASAKPSEANKATAAPPPSPADNRSGPDKLSEELQKLGSQWDQQTKEQLLEDLRQTDPSLWPAVIQQYKAVENYRRNARSEDVPQEAGSSEAAERSTSNLPATHQSNNLPESNNLPASGAGQSRAAGLGGRPQEWGISGGARPARLPPPGETLLPPELAPNGNYVTTGYPPLGQPSESGCRADRSGSSGKPGIVAVKGSAAAENKEEGAAGVCSVAALSPPGLYGPWHAHVDAATRALEAELGADWQAANSLGQIARLSLLYLVSGRREDAFRMFRESASAEADYWRRQVYALAVWLDEHREPDQRRRAAQTCLALEEAIARLGDAAPLVVRNLVFCTEVQSYGCYKPVASSEFAPEQEVLLYAEIENFASEETPKGFYTKLRSSYQLFDARGQAVAEYDGTVTEDYCRNRRRDYFNCYHLRLPARIYPGKHTLRLTVEDMIGQKVGQSSIDFMIKEPAAETTARRRGLR